MSNKQISILDGSKVSTLPEFAQHFSQIVLKEHEWRGNLDAFDDILYGGFGTLIEGLILHWKNSDLSRQRLALKTY